MRRSSLHLAIVDYGRGNLYSVRAACAHVGMAAEITDSPEALATADAVILPGVGAFGDAMSELQRRELVDPIRELAVAGKPMIGICLGLQLFMTESREFGNHEGLGLIDGDVVRFESPRGKDGTLKVPQIGWNRVRVPVDRPNRWAGTPLAGQADGVYQYFVHSFYARPADPAVICAATTYGDVTYASSLHVRNVFACQFHPERSGRDGLKVYDTMAEWISSQIEN